MKEEFKPFTAHQFNLLSTETLIPNILLEKHNSVEESHASLECTSFYTKAQVPFLKLENHNDAFSQAVEFT